MNKLTPTLRTLPNGKVVYFYTPQQIANNQPEEIRHPKAKHNDVNCGSSGIMTPAHITATHE